MIRIQMEFSVRVRVLATEVNVDFVTCALKLAGLGSRELIVCISSQLPIQW